MIKSEEQDQDNQEHPQETQDNQPESSQPPFKNESRKSAIMEPVQINNQETHQEKVRLK